MAKRAPIEPPLSDPTTVPELPRVPGYSGGQLRIREDARWAYQNMHAEVEDTDAPSPGAWWLRQQGLIDPKPLLQILMVMAKEQTEDAEEREVRRDCRRTEKQLTETIDRLVDAMPL